MLEYLDFKFHSQFVTLTMRTQYHDSCNKHWLDNDLQCIPFCLNHKWYDIKGIFWTGCDLHNWMATNDDLTISTILDLCCVCRTVLMS